MRDKLREPVTSIVRTRPNPRYVALLVGAALLVLAVGALLRPKAKPVSAIPTNELANLPEHTQRKMMRDMAAYVGERVTAVARSIVYLAAVNASGLVLGRDSVLSVSASSPSSAIAVHAAPTPVFLLRPPAAGASPAAHAGRGDMLLPHWGLVVARAADGAPLALTGMTGGLIPVRCGELALRELVFDAVVPLAFGGGGVFDLDGNALALAVPCDGRIALVPLGDIAGALERQQTPGYRLWARYGFRFTPMDSLTRVVLGADSGRVVTEVLVGGAADLAGLRPGDVLAHIDTFASVSAADLAPPHATPGGHRLVVQRANSVVTLAVVSETDLARGIGLMPQPSRVRHAPTIADVPAESRAARAGLKAGDRIVAIGRNWRPTAAAVRRVLADSAPVFLVYERQERRRGVLLR